MLHTARSCRKVSNCCWLYVRPSACNKSGLPTKLASARLIGEEKNCDIVREEKRWKKWSERMQRKGVMWSRARTEGRQGPAAAADRQWRHPQCPARLSCLSRNWSEKGCLDWLSLISTVLILFQTVSSSYFRGSWVCLGQVENLLSE